MNDGPDPMASAGVLDTFCPMHVLLDSTGHIRHAGPAFCKLWPGDRPEGQRLMELVELRRPRAAGSMDSLLALAGLKLHFALRSPPRTEMKGVLVPLPESAGAVLNLSFGISIVDAVHDYALTGADFAATDLAVEMLYLVEAKSAAMDELHRLNLRLNYARLLAEEQASTDKLTGLGNRWALEPVLARVREAAQDFSLMHLDLDHFKAANDTFGHAAGDHVLQTVAQRLVANTREKDTVIRLGGDEFLLVLPDQARPEPVSDLACRLIRDIERPVSFGGRAIRVSASIGVSLSTAYDTVDTARMMRDADTALYAAKAAGRKGFRLFCPDCGVMTAGVEADAPPQV